jgi:putative membrane protein
MHIGKLGVSLVLMSALVIGKMAPAFAVSLSSTSNPQPIPEDIRGAVTPLAIESWSTGSATLVPLMAADVQATRTTPVDEPANTTGAAVGKPVDDVTFVKRATESGRKEVAAARDALPQLKAPELKRIAEMLVQDHSKANAKLSKLAEAKGWPVPAAQPATPPATGTASGDFDQKWTAEMITGHERSIALYRAQAQGGEDQDLRKYAHDTLPTIEHHLEELRRLQK